MTLREKLIVLRDESGISQMALAHQLGVSRQAVTRWESGETKPSMDKLKALAKIYDVSLDWLCNDIDKDETTKNEESKENDPKENGKVLVAERENKKNTHRLTIVIVAVAIVILAVSVIYSINRNRKNEKVDTQIEDMEQDKSESSAEGSFDFEW